MFLTVKKQTILSFCSAILLLLAFAAAFFRGSAAQPVAAYQNIPADPLPTLIIDPGHGGEDGGAVGEGGTVESHINLAIALKTRDLAQFLGWQTVMTREEDVSIHDIDAQTLRQKKVSDLKNRVALCNNQKNAILVSIHQNSLPTSPKTRGAQAFYNRIPGSEALAAGLQTTLNAALHPAKGRTAAEVPDTVYLMKHVACPGVLVECGFLSNADEAQLLTTPTHQKRVAVAVIAGISGYFRLNSP